MTQLPNGKIAKASDLGALVKDKRMKDKLTQADTAALCEVGNRFISDLENGKSTVQLGKTLQVLKCLGLEVYVLQRSWPDKLRR